MPELTDNQIAEIRCSPSFSPSFFAWTIGFTTQPFVSETPCTYVDTSLGNREIPSSPKAAVALGRALVSCLLSVSL